MTTNNNARPRGTVWRKSSYSRPQGECVEVADLDRGVGVRDSKNPDAGHLTFDASQWQAFTARLHRGELDR